MGNSQAPGSGNPGYTFKLELFVIGELVGEGGTATARSGCATKCGIVNWREDEISLNCVSFIWRYAEI